MSLDQFHFLSLFPSFCGFPNAIESAFVCNLNSRREKNITRLKYIGEEIQKALEKYQDFPLPASDYTSS